MKPSNSTGMLETWAIFVSGISLFGTIYSFKLTFPVGSGYYGGTTVLIWIIILFQSLFVGAGVIIPVYVAKERRRIELPRFVRKMILLAVAGILIEIALICIIPVSGAS